MPQIDVSHYSVEDLKAMQLFFNKKGRPTSDMTDKIWQEIFEQLKEKTMPYIDGEKKTMSYKFSYKTRSDDVLFELDQTTDWSRYCSFINTVLKDIRKGKKVFCFYYYQIIDLLKYHKNDLRTLYDSKERQWEVWLDGANKN